MVCLVFVNRFQLKKHFDFQLMHDVFSYVGVLGRHRIYFWGLELKNKTKQKTRNTLWCGKGGYRALKGLLFWRRSRMQGHPLRWGWLDGALSCQRSSPAVSTGRESPHTVSAESRVRTAAAPPHFQPLPSTEDSAAKHKQTGLIAARTHPNTPRLFIGIFLKNRL